MDADSRPTLSNVRLRHAAAGVVELLGRSLVATETEQLTSYPRGSHMPARPQSVVPLSLLEEGQEADTFVLLARKEELKTRDGKPYWRVSFRDAKREVAFPIWGDSPLAEECRTWQVGSCFKVRGLYRVTNYGPQLEIRRIRPVAEEDKAEGFDPLAFGATSRFEPMAMMAELLKIIETEIADASLAALVKGTLTEQQEVLLDLPAALHHHNIRSGWLEHALSVARNAVFLATQYGETYPEQLPQSSRDLVVAGAVLHDIGKLLELRATPGGAAFTPHGELIGHIVLGRDLLREAATRYPIEAELLLRLEHIILSHQRTAEWGSPKPPLTPEALLVFYADDIDAKLNMMVEALQNDTNEGFMTSKKNAWAQKVFKGLPE